MGACRYGIYLRVFNLIARAWAQSYEWDVELNTRREILHLQATTHYFVYHINTIALCWQYFINEWKWKDRQSPNKNVKCVGTSKMKTCVDHYKNKQWAQFFINKILSYWLGPYRQMKSFRYTKSACGKSSSCQLSFSATRNAITKATECVTFDFPLPIYSIWIFFCFSSHNAKQFR